MKFIHKRSGKNKKMENEKYLVEYTTPDFNGKRFITREKEFYFKDEASCFAQKMEEKYKVKTYVYKLIIKKELIA